MFLKVTKLHTNFQSLKCFGGIATHLHTRMENGSADLEVNYKKCQVLDPSVPSKKYYLCLHTFFY